MTDDPTPFVRFVVVNHNGGDLLARCVGSITACDHPANRREVVVIDNASTDDSMASIADSGARTIANAENTGFGANNQAMDQLDGVDAVMLLNPDAVIAPDATGLLLEALGSDPRVGAACPHIVFDQLFGELAIAVPGGPVTVEAVEIGGVDHLGDCHLVPDGSGRAPRRVPRRDGSAPWVVDGAAVLRSPIGGRAEVRLHNWSPAPVQATLGAATFAVAGGEAVTRTVELPEPNRVIVQNAGSDVDRFGVGHNRGFWQRDDRFTADPDTAAWCGAAVLLKADYLRDVGLFEPDYFLYYEDTDLSLRGRAAGWRYRYAAGAVVQHRHSAVAGQGSANTDVLQQRNRLITSARNGSLAEAAQTWGHALATTAKMFASGLRSEQRGGPIDTTLARRRARGLGAAARALPGVLRYRRGR